MAYDPSGNYLGTSSTALPGSANNASLGVAGITTGDAQRTVPAEQGQQPKTIAQIISAFEALDPTSQANMAQMLYSAGMYSDPIQHGGQSIGNSDIYAALGKAALIASNTGQPLSQVLFQQAQVHADEVAAHPYPGTAIRTLGLGKYPLVYTNPATVLQAADSIVKQLLGRRATPSEVQAIGSILHSQEQTEKQAEYQSYLSQEETSAELFHGGVAKPADMSLAAIQAAIGGQAAVTGQLAPTSLAPVGTPPGAPSTAAGTIDSSGNYVPPPNVVAHPPPGMPPQGTITAKGAKPLPNNGAPATISGPVSPAEAQQLAARGQTSPIANPGTAAPAQVVTPAAPPAAGPTPAAGNAAVPPGAQTIVLGDGTVMVLPQQFSATAAPTAGEAAYQYVMQNEQPEVQGAAVGQAMQAIAQFIGQK